MRIRSSLYAGSIKVYGVRNCGWTKKQLNYLTNKGIPYLFVDCDAQGCPGFVEAYPTLEIDGKVSVGFREI